MRIPRALCGAFVSLILLCGGTLRAQPAPPTGTVNETTEMTDRARALYIEGQKAAAKGHWGEAHAAWLAAWGLKKQYQIAANLGTAEAHLGRYREAAEHLSYYVREAPERKAKERETARKLLAEVRAHVAALTLKVEPEGAKVLVDGVTVGTAPLREEVFVDPGARAIEATLAGYEAVKVTMEVKAGEARVVPIALVKSEVKPRASGAGGASAATGGTTATTGSGSGGQTPNGGATGGPRAGGLHPGVLFAGIASSAVAITGGVVFAIVSSVKGNDADEQQAALFQDGFGRACEKPTALAARCADLESSLAARDTFGHLSLWSFVIGGTLGMGTAVYVLATPKTKSTSTVRALPMASAQGGGLVVVGEW
jgi:hypothetical protein